MNITLFYNNQTYVFSNKIERNLNISVLVISKYPLKAYIERGTFENFYAQARKQQTRRALQPNANRWRQLNCLQAGQNK